MVVGYLLVPAKDNCLLLLVLTQGIHILSLAAFCIYFVFLARIPYAVGRDSSVGIATYYELNGPRIESWWGRHFPHPSTLAVGPTSYTMVTAPLSWG